MLLDYTRMSTEALLKSHAKKFASMDPYFSLDALILEAMMGEQGAELLKAKLLETVKTCEAHPETLQEEVTKLLDKQRLKWCRESVRSEVECARDMLQRMLASESVVRSEAPTTAWLTSVLKAMEMYIKFSPAAGGSAASTDTTQLKGLPALTKMYDMLVQQPPSTLDKLQVFTTWRHLLSAEQSDKVAAWRSGLLKQGAVAPTAVKTTSVAVPKKPSKRKAATTSAEDIDAAALALLGLKSS